MKIALDPDVEKVMEFMAREIKGARLLFVARSVAKVAELAWADAIPKATPDNALAVSDWRGGLVSQRLDD